MGTIRARSRRHVIEQRTDAGQGAVEGLVDRSIEIQPRMQPDVGSAEVCAAQAGTRSEHAVQPAQAILRDRLQPGRLSGSTGIRDRKRASPSA